MKFEFFEVPFSCSIISLEFFAMRVLLPNGEIVEDDKIPRRYRTVDYVLKWSDDHGGIYVVTSTGGVVPIGEF